MPDCSAIWRQWEHEISVNIPINLSSEPFRPYRAILAASLTVGALLTATLILLVGLAINQQNQMREERASLNQLNRQLTTIEREETQIEATLRRPENAVVLERSILLNELIDRKAISWTKLFEDIEKVMPYNVRLMQVQLPLINLRNQVELDMSVGTQSPEPYVDFLIQLENSPVFGPPVMRSFQGPTPTNPLYQYTLSVSYAQKH